MENMTEPCKDMPENCKKGFLEEEPGKFSTTRLMSLISLAAACGFGYLTLTTNSDSGILITVSFLTAAFGGKVASKAFEEKKP
jgi:hypothetical protein